MKTLILGSNGQLGHALVDTFGQSGCDVRGLDLPEFDITDFDMVQEVIHTIQPDMTVNASAYTQVDKAESDSQIAYAVNEKGPKNLAKASKRNHIPLIHVSTDFVFDGTKITPYIETDAIRPLGVYGSSKAAGDEAVRKFATQHIIIRTSWLYGVHGNNFVKTMIRLGRNNEKLKVVSDQKGCPTAAEDLALAIHAICQNVFSNKNKVKWGTYHYCGRGVTSWHGFTKTILELAEKHIPIRAKEILPIPTKEYPTPAKRPPYSALNCDQIEAAFGVKTRPWQESLSETIEKIFALNTIELLS